MALQLLNSKHQSQIDAGILMSMIVHDTFKEKAVGILEIYTDYRFCRQNFDHIKV
jgi:hypothetical protein